jgi:hypothetical protein
MLMSNNGRYVTLHPLPCRRPLTVCHGCPLLTSSYECEEHGGGFMLAFYEAQDATLWALDVQVGTKH